MTLKHEPRSQSRGSRGAIRIKHILIRERETLCGARIAGLPPSPGADACAVCLDLSRRGWTGRP
ncbi:MAG: hypothetical protein QOG35_1778 [Solirubrobacteraceae bacterium]|jgi:hypothetical protein|nr:hypothetical protein [Solirubrobacteraceae bacterium]